MGLTKSELVKRLLKKISFDDKLKDIIKRGYVTTSHNVHYGNEQKNLDNNEGKNNPGDQSGEKASSMAPTRILPENDQMLQHMIEVARTRWIDEDF